MKDALKRMLSHFGTETAQAEYKEEDVNMDVNDTGGSAADAVELSTSLASVTEKLTAAQARIDELTAVLEAAGEFKAKAEKQALDAKMDARKVKIVAAVGTENADKLMSATAGLEDAQFDAVLAVAGVSSKVEAQTAPFKEVGVDAKADASKLASNPTMDILLAKYPQA